MKIFLLADYYEKYLKNFYEKNSCEHLNYSEHLKLLLDDYFGSFVSYYRHFKKIGHEAKLIIGNDYTLQNKWLKENGYAFKANNATKQKVVFEQIKQFSPHVFFMGSMFDYYGAFLKDVSGITQNIFTWIACPYKNDLDFSNVKCIISSSSKYVDTFKSKGLNSEVLRAAFDSDILEKIDVFKKYEVSFIGGLSKIHKERICKIKKLVSNDIDINIFGYGLKRSHLSIFKSPIEKVYKGELWGLEMYETLSQSNITLNFHIKEAEGLSGNMRMYEATGCGSLLFSENTMNLSTLFEPNEEMIPYDSIEDLMDKINYYTSHKDKAKKIAKSGQKRCLEQHDYNKRILEFEKIINMYRD